MSEVSGESPSSAWVYSEEDSVQSASARSTAPSHKPPHPSASARYFSFRTAALSGVSSPAGSASLTAATTGASPRLCSSGVVAAGDVDAEVEGGRGEEQRIREGVSLLERHPDFMRFFFEHLTGCPPRGPFRYYAALTLVQRARRRYALDANDLSAADSCGEDGVGETGASAEGRDRASVDGEHMNAANPGASADARRGLVPSSTSSARATAAGYCTSIDALRDALTITTVLALMEMCFDTHHLKSWELLYVPAEVRSTDVQALLEAKHQQRESHSGEQRL